MDYNFGAFKLFPVGDADICENMTGTGDAFVNPQYLHEKTMNDIILSMFPSEDTLLGIIDFIKVEFDYDSLFDSLKFGFTGVDSIITIKDSINSSVTIDLYNVHLIDTIELMISNYYFEGRDSSGIPQFDTINISTGESSGYVKKIQTNVNLKPYLTISDIQYTDNPTGESDYNGEVVLISGVVTRIFGGNCFIQDTTDQKEWSGLYVYQIGGGINIGDLLSIEANVYEYYGFTQLKNIVNYDKISVGNTIPEPVSLSCSAVSDEKYESVLAMISGVTVTTEEDYNSVWEVNDASGSCLIKERVEMPYSYIPTIGDKLFSITGPLVEYNYDTYNIVPATDNDIEELIKGTGTITLNPIQANCNTMNDISLVIKPSADTVFGYIGYIKVQFEPDTLTDTLIYDCSLADSSTMMKDSITGSVTIEIFKNDLEDSIVLNISNYYFSGIDIAGNAKNDTFFIKTGQSKNNIAYISRLPYISSMLDDDEPIITSISPESGSYIKNSNPNIIITLESVKENSGLDSCYVSLDNVNITDSLNITSQLIVYSKIATLNEGEHTVYAYIKDNAGNYCDSTWSFWVDITEPVIDSIFPTGGNQVKENQPDIYIYYTENMIIDSTVYINSVDYSSFSGITDSCVVISGYTEIFPYGPNIVNVRIQDKAGNMSDTYTDSFFVYDIYEEGKVIAFPNPADKGEGQSSIVFGGLSSGMVYVVSLFRTSAKV